MSQTEEVADRKWFEETLESHGGEMFDHELAKEFRERLDIRLCDHCLDEGVMRMGKVDTDGGYILCNSCFRDEETN